MAHPLFVRDNPAVSGLFPVQRVAAVPGVTGVALAASDLLIARGTATGRNWQVDVPLECLRQSGTVGGVLLAVGGFSDAPTQIGFFLIGF